MTNVSKHTPAPWYYSNGSIYSKSEKGGLPIAQIYEVFKDDDEAQANASFVVRACNNHYGLLEALEEAEEFVDSHSEDWYKSGQKLLAKIRAAIAKATGKGVSS